MKQFKNILVSVDCRSSFHPAIEWAVRVGTPKQSKLTLVDVQRDMGWPARMALRDYQYVMDHEREHKAEKLAELGESLRHGGFEVETRVPSGSTSVEIVREVLREKHDLVVRVAKGTGSVRAGFFGSTTMRLLRKCPCPVLAVNPDAHPHFQKIVAAVDPSPADAGHAQLNTAIMAFSKSLGELAGTQPMVVHAWMMLGEGVLQSRMADREFEEHSRHARQQVESAYNKFLAWHELSLDSDNVHLLNGTPEIAIPLFAEEHSVDLIVMGTIARTGVSGLLMGNTAERILGAVRCTILALKPDSFVSPIQPG